MKNKLIPVLLGVLGFVMTGCQPDMYACPSIGFEVKENTVENGPVDGVWTAADDDAAGVMPEN